MPHRLLIIRLSAFGDIIHTLPAFLLLRKSFPDAQIDWLVEKKWQSLLEIIPDINEVITADTYKWRKGLLNSGNWKEIKALKRLLRRKQYDLAVDFQGLLKSGLLAKTSRAKHIGGFDRRELREPLASLFYTKSYFTDGEKGNVIWKNLALAQAVRIEFNSSRAGQIPMSHNLDDEIHFPAFTVDNTALRKLKRELLFLGSDKYCLFHTGSTWPSKRIPARIQAEIIDFLESELSMKTVLIGTSGDVEIAKQVSDLCKESTPVFVQTSVRELVELIRSASLFIGSDSGPLHLASALGKPVIGIYGPTDPKRNGPVGRYSGVVEAPCRKKYCWKKHCSENCMSQVSVRHVAEKARDLLKLSSG